MADERDKEYPGSLTVCFKCMYVVETSRDTHKHTRIFYRQIIKRSTENFI